MSIYALHSENSPRKLGLYENYKGISGIFWRLVDIVCEDWSERAAITPFYLLVTSSAVGYCSAPVC